MAFYSASFVCAFLPVLLIVYYLIPGQRGKNAVLIAASLVFYAFGDLRWLPLLLASAVLHYGAGVLLLQNVRRKKWLVSTVITADLAVLLGFKLFGVLPLGISFYTFQAVSYIVDVGRDQKNGSRSFAEVLQYITFFPQLVSGPLARFSEIRTFITGRRPDTREIAEGMRRFTVGLAKKVLIGTAAAKLTDAVFALSAAELDFRSAWLGAVCYAVQIYFDFSGYSDMAVGLGHLFGYTLPENFRYPYTASSVTDFWRRWHMTLSAWFRDYLYIPLGGNRRGLGRTCLNKLIVFLATGFWHGSSVTFLLWGVWHGLWSILETLPGWRRVVEKKRWYCYPYAALIAVIGFVIFRAESLSQAWSVIASMFSGFALRAESGRIFTHVLAGRDLFFLILGVILCFPVAPKLRGLLEKRNLFQPVSLVLTLFLLVICLMTIASGSFRPFIYAQF